MGIVKTFREFINESMKPVPRNSELFEKELKERGLTYADIFNRLKENGLDKEFDDIISEFGITQGEDGDYTPGREFYAADRGKRTHDEIYTDVRIGNIQEALFLLNNNAFRRNPKAEFGHNDDITKAPDFIFKPNGGKVEFAVSYTTIKDDIIKYTYRDSGFKYFLNEDKIIIIYFIKENKVAVIGRSNCNRRKDGNDKDAQIRIENMTSKTTGKPIDVVIIKTDCLIDYDMFSDGDNPEIKNRVGQIIQETSNTPKFDFRDDEYYRQSRLDKVYDINLNKKRKTWVIENKKKCRDEWDRLTNMMKNKVKSGEYSSKDARDIRRKLYIKFAQSHNLNKAEIWIPDFSKNDTL